MNESVTAAAAPPRSTLETARRVALALVLLAALADLPARADYLRQALPVIARRDDPLAQAQLQFPGVPEALLRAVEARVPPGATVLLVTPGRAARREEYVTYHRALYRLAPRPVWWLTPAPPDGTWESRWWRSAALGPEAVRAAARELGATYVLAIGLAAPLDVGERVLLTDEGELRALVPGAALPDGGASPWPLAAEAAGPRWPLQLALACGVWLVLGDALVGLAGRLGRRPAGVERLALAWALGALAGSLAMLWLSALGVNLALQAGLTTAGVFAAWVALRRSAQGAADSAPTGPRDSPRPALAQPVRGLLTAGLLLLIVLHFGYVALLATGRPLHIWDSWANWGSKARAIFVTGGITPTVYADPSRLSLLPDYPLLVPLAEAWVYTWLGAADDRLAGVPVVLAYLALAGLVYAAVGRRSGDRLLALAASAAAVTLADIAGLAALVFAELPLALYLLAAGVYLAEWLERGDRGALFIAALAVGALPWTKREGWLLAGVLLAVLAVGTALRAPVRSRAAAALGALAAATALIAGPWALFTAVRGLASPVFLPVEPATLVANLDRAVVVARTALASLLSLRWGYLWPLAALVAALVAALAWRPERPQPLGWVLAAAAAYLAVAGLSYLFSAYMPFQQHVASSIDRLIAPLAPLVVVWLAAGGEPLRR